MVAAREAEPATQEDHDVAAQELREALTEMRKAEAAEKDADAAEQMANRRAARCRKEAHKRRIAVGRLLLAHRSRWPERGPNAKGWGDFLREVDVREQSAREWMDLAQVSKPDDGGLEMTREQVRAAKKASETGDTVHDADRARRAAIARVKNRDHAQRQLRNAITQMVKGGHQPDRIEEVLNEWTEYRPEDRRSICDELAAELRALADVLERLK